MRTAVIVGAGVVGVTTAEALVERGFQVTVVEAMPRAAEGASMANAAQLCAPFALALGSPGFLNALPRNLLDLSSGVSLSLATAVANVPWSVRFLFECRSARAKANSEALLALAYQSAAALDQLLERHPLEFDRRTSGKLWLAPNVEAFRQAGAELELRHSAGFEVEALSRNECLSVEPRLTDAGYPFAGGIFAPASAVGDCRAFTIGLAERLEKAGVAFRFGTRVDQIEVSDARAVGVRVGEDLVAADIVVLANGLDAPRLAPRFRGRQPIAPLRGYSATLPLGSGAPTVSLTDPKRAVALCRLGNRMRITGSGEFAGPGRPSRQKIKRILDVARRWFPDAADFDATDQQEWCGVRPTTPNSLPMIGPAGPEGLYINAGHGTFGWTLAAGSAERLASML
nr:FAD-dependent oxidoreductase [Pseudosulfitobacter pseudonitzschiae]